jgi:hypothetical protein
MSKNKPYKKLPFTSILTAVVACGEIHELVVVVCGILAVVGGEISLFVDDKTSIVGPAESKFAI